MLRSTTQVANAQVRPIQRVVKPLSIANDALGAWQQLKPTLRSLIRVVAARRALELGGGRYPLFTADEADELGLELTVNDIDSKELAQLPHVYSTAVFDIAGPREAIPIESGSFDLIYSKMVFEHVRDGRMAWSNVHHLLATGGVGFAFVPTLYSPPFVLNRCLPEWLTRRLLQRLDFKRNDLEVPKFPAYYSWCRASEDALRPMLRSVGFRDAAVFPFFGTPYFPGIPLLVTVTAAFDRMVLRRDWRTFASYAYIIAIK